MRKELIVKKGIPSLVSEDNAWDIIHDGLGLEKSVRFNYPQRLQGPDGIICRKAVLGACIIWTNSSLNQMGYIHGLLHRLQRLEIAYLRFYATDQYLCTMAAA